MSINIEELLDLGGEGLDGSQPPRSEDPGTVLLPSQTLAQIITKDS